MDLGPFRHRSFAWLVTGATVNNLGGALAPVALAFAVLDLGGSATQLGVVVGAYALAEVTTALFGGVLGDRLPRTVMMEGSASLSALVQGVTAYALVTGSATIPFLTVMGLVGGVVSALAGPSSSAMTPLTVPAAELPAAVALRRLGSNGAMILGFAVAGVVVAAYGPGVAIAADAVTYVLAAVCFARMRVPHVRPEHQPSLVREFGDGAREVFRHTWLWVLIGQAFLYHLVFGGAQGVLGPIVVGDRFGRAAWGWSLSALMLGFVAGGLLTLRWRPRRALLVGTASLSLTAAFPFAMALSPSTAGVLAGAFLHGLGLEVFSVWWDTSIQQQVPADRLARVYSFDHVGSFAARPAGLALTGPVAEWAGEARWLVVVGLVMGTSSLLALLVPGVRRLERVQPAPEPEPAPLG